MSRAIGFESNGPVSEEDFEVLLNALYTMDGWSVDAYSDDRLASFLLTHKDD